MLSNQDVRIIVALTFPILSLDVSDGEESISPQLDFNKGDIQNPDRLLL